jgi:hypothetical protein
MLPEEQSHECKEVLEKLVGKKVVGIDFKTYENECWRIYITTDQGQMVMTFCKDWGCPVVEDRAYVEEHFDD